MLVRGLERLSRPRPGSSKQVGPYTINGAESRLARPNERSDAIRDTYPADRVGATHRVERELEKVYLELTGT
jgi:hypothetical protein